jgi:anti-anti-sigma regulatory factor
VTQDLSEGVLEEARRVMLEGVQRDEANAAILELTAVPFMDSHEFTQLRAATRMAELLGARTAIVGLQPGIIAHLMAANVDTSGVTGFLGLEEALRALRERAGDGHA